MKAPNTNPKVFQIKIDKSVTTLRFPSSILYALANKIEPIKVLPPSQKNSVLFAFTNSMYSGGGFEMPLPSTFHFKFTTHPLKTNM